MRKSRKVKSNSHITTAVDNPIAVLTIAILGILLGIFFIVSQNANKPIAREAAISYSGNFDYYDTAWENYREIHFEDGSVYDIYPHTESDKFRKKMKSLEKGTKLYILINPNNDYIVEVRTDTEELLNFELSQQEIDAYDNGYIAIGIFACVAGVYLIIYVIGSTNYKRKESARHSVRKKENPAAAMRDADGTVKSKTLLQASVEAYQICYRRVRSTNELVINGRVYDEKKGIFEFEHKLCATIDGHNIEAGYDNEDYSYIMFDGEIIKRKKRWI